MFQSIYLRLQLRKFLFAALVFILVNQLHAQKVVGGFRDERELYAETKQINQFIRRFNSEEDLRGNRLYAKDKIYHDHDTRVNYFKLLFDNSNKGVSEELKKEFINDVTKIDLPFFLSFHGPDWFAEVNAVFTINGKTEDVKVFLRLQKEKVGSKWVLFNIYYPPFEKFFHPQDTANHHFLHPMSHELEFMNLYRVFSEESNVQDYAYNGFKPDQLTLFFHEIGKGNVKFKTVNNVKFHFFQAKGWYFEVSKFTRTGFNSGWLISNLVKLHSTKEKNILLDYIFKD